VFKAVVFYVYFKAHAKPWILIPLVLSQRIHSIFVLRLFNDVFAMLFLYLSVALFANHRWSLGCVLFSLGVSVKMNVLLFAPGLLLLLIQTFGIWGAIPKLTICAAVQIILGLPFLVTYPWSYLARSFELGRKFLFVWTVNWRFLGEEIFNDKRFAVGLLIAHLVVLSVFLWAKGRPRYLPRSKETTHSTPRFTPDYIIDILFISNIIGIVFARSLHYQFYVWYFHTLPLLLYTTWLPFYAILFLLIPIENAWMTFPSTSFSSISLLVTHLFILVSLFTTPASLDLKVYDKKRN